MQIDRIDAQHSLEHFLSLTLKKRKRYKTRTTACLGDSRGSVTDVFRIAFSGLNEGRLTVERRPLDVDGLVEGSEVLPVFGMTPPMDADRTSGCSRLTSLFSSGSSSKLTRGPKTAAPQELGAELFPTDCSWGVGSVEVCWLKVASIEMHPLSGDNSCREDGESC